jgi:hypothetical protein
MVVGPAVAAGALVEVAIVDEVGPLGRWPVPPLARKPVGFRSQPVSDTASAIAASPVTAVHRLMTLVS